VLGGLNAAGRSKKIVCAVALAVFLAPLSPAPAREPEVIADVVEAAIDGVVSLSVKRALPASAKKQPESSNPSDEFFEKFFQNRGGRADRNPPVIGSGFILDPDGLILTANGIMADAEQVMVTLRDGTQAEAEILGSDRDNDLALLKIKPPKPVKFLKLGDSRTLRLGTRVIAIGNPYNFGGTVTAGIVSGLHRDVRNAAFHDFIQIDAVLNRGSAGGPLLNLDGEVIGVNSSIYSTSGAWMGIGFAVPSNKVAEVVKQLREAAPRK
jgi:serine protease Do